MNEQSHKVSCPNCDRSFWLPDMATAVPKLVRCPYCQTVLEIEWEMKGVKVQSTPEEKD